MTTVYGVTPTGFMTKSFEVILEEMISDARSVFGFDPEIDLSENTRVGRWLRINAEREVLWWEAMQGVYASQYPDSATGTSLIDVAAITGTRPEEPTRSTVTLTVTTTPTVTIPLGAIVTGASGTPRFRTTAAVTTDGAGAGTVPAECVDYGPIQALAGTLTRIETTVSGWVSVTNATDATLGKALETDEQLRLRREEELTAQGGASVPGIRARVLKVAGVDACRIFENSTDVTDADGVPPHGFEAVVQGGDDQAIGEAIWAAKAAGIRTHGGVLVDVIDAEGHGQSVYFNRPSPVTIVVAVTAVVDLVGDAFVEWVESTAGDDFATAIRTAIVARGLRFGVGADVIRSAFYKAVADVDSLIVDVPTLTLNGGTANVVITPRQRSNFDSSNVSVSFLERTFDTD